MAQLVEHLNHDFSLGHDLGSGSISMGWSPVAGSTLSGEGDCFSPSPSVPLQLLHTHTLSLNPLSNKYIFLKKERKKYSDNKQSLN